MALPRFRATMSPEHLAAIHIRSKSAFGPCCLCQFQRDRESLKYLSSDNAVFVRILLTLLLGFGDQAWLGAVGPRKIVPAFDRRIPIISVEAFDVELVIFGILSHDVDLFL